MAQCALSANRLRVLLAFIFPMGLAVLLGCERFEEPAEPPPPRTAPENEGVKEGSAPKNAIPAAKAGVAPKANNTPAEEVNLIGDEPQAGAEAAPKKPVLLEEFKPEGHLGWTARRAYALLADTKTRFESISADLDNGGKEITRLITTSDQLAHSITDLFNLWPHDEAFRDVCGGAKSRVLLLNDELSQVPRNWPHVRWAFNDVVQELRKLRRQTRDLAEAEPKLTPVVSKDGKVTYVEPEPPPIDPAIARRERKIQEVEKAQEALRKIEALKQRQSMKNDAND